MGKPRTWWGERFLAAVVRYTDAGRLARGRSYANNGRVETVAIAAGEVKARVLGSANPYYGVYKAPHYTTTLRFEAITAAEWRRVLARTTAHAGHVAQLLLGEMPEDIEAAFEAEGLHLLPHPQARPQARCSCPDSSNPCKHIAGLYYVLAGQLDRDPFLAFELRGLTREALAAELARSPLGAALAAGLVPGSTAADASLFPDPAAAVLPTTASIRGFWTAAERLPAELPDASPARLPGLLVRREGDHPAFWPRSESFLAVMDDLYERVRRAQS